MTRFEWEILQTLAVISFPYPDDTVCLRGKELFGNDWGGKMQETKEGLSYSPQVAMALGKLCKKGLAVKISTGALNHLYEISKEGKRIVHDTL